MNKTKKTFASLAIAVASVSAYIGGDALVGHIRFAHAEQEVHDTREELKTVTGLSDVFRKVGHAVKPSVVQIQVHKAIKGLVIPGMPDDGEELPQLPNGLGNGQGGAVPEEIGTGSGVIMEVDGDTAYILTNNHVAGDATKLTVTLADGRVINNGKTIGADPKSDLAVVRITADHLIPAVWGDSSKLDRGDWVLAFGSPFGYVGSMTHGIVSALDRQAGILRDVEGYEDFIQVDAPINPGNSGGPLVNIQGEVVGINTAIASRSGGFQGIGFAIPSNQAKLIYNELKDHGKVVRGWLGVQIMDVSKDPDAAKQLGYTAETGVMVDGVLKGTPSFGKLQPGDVIEKVNGTAVADSLALRNEVAATAPGKDIKLTVFRDKKDVDVTVTLGEQPANLMAMQMGQQSQDVARIAALGLQLSDSPKHDGALVTAVKAGSLAEAADIKVDDLITRVGDDTVKSASDVQSALSGMDIHKGVRFYITNSDGYRVVTLGEQQP
jgi:serine protease Do